jgi:hypothetical protein
MQLALERQKRCADEALAAAEEQHRAQSRKLGQDVDTEKKGAQVRLAGSGGQDLVRCCCASVLVRHFRLCRWLLQH